MRLLLFLIKKRRGFVAVRSFRIKTSDNGLMASGPGDRGAPRLRRKTVRYSNGRVVLGRGLKKNGDCIVYKS